jgi:magnesium transporter
MKRPADPRRDHEAPGRETCAEHLSPRALLAHEDDTVGTVRHSVRRLGRNGVWELVCVVDQDRRLLGTLSARDLLVLPDAARVGACMDRQPPSMRASAEPEQMASMALHHGVAAMPVLDEQGRLLGVAGPAALMDILRREHVSDLHRLAGITRETRKARQAIEEPPLRRVRHRLPWLLVGLAGSMLATLVVSRFEASIAERTALAFFVPGLVYLADAIGTQTEAVAVRGLSISRMGLARLASGELRSGLLIGLLLALLVFPMVWWVFGDARLAATVGAALAAASTVASLLGLLLPWALQRRGLDPAYGSGPLATIIQDVLSLLIYFLCAAAILG